MRWTVRLEARTDQGVVKRTELVTFNRPVVDGTLADLGLALSEAKAVLAKLQVIMVRGQVAEYAARHRICPRGSVRTRASWSSGVALVGSRAIGSGGAGWTAWPAARPR